ASPTWGAGGRELRAVQLMGMLGDDVRHLLIAHDGCFSALDHAASRLDLEPVVRAFGGPVWRRLGAMVAYLRAVQPDLLLVYNWGAIEWLLAARLARVRAVVHHEDGFGPEEVRRRLRRRNHARRMLLG